MKAIAILFLIIIFTSCQSPQTKYENSVKLQQIVHSCQSCHSQGQQLLAPSLSGLEDWYIKEQLYKFQEGIRGGNSASTAAQTMHKAAKMLNPKQINFLAKWYSKQPVKKESPTVKGDNLKGEVLYKQNCSGCHSGGPGKFFTGSPSLKQLPDWYIFTQVKNFKTGKRGSNPQDKKGLKMAERVKDLDDEQLQNIAAFLHKR